MNAIWVLSGLVLFLTGFVLGGRIAGKRVWKYKIKNDRVTSELYLENQWIKLHTSGRKATDYFKNRNMTKIIVYGIGDIGKRLYEECVAEKIGDEGLVMVDKKAKSLSDLFPYKVLSPDDEMPDADCVVITPMVYEDEIRSDMINKVSCPIVTIRDVLFDM